MTFPLYRRPTSVVLLDDDVRFLDLVGVVLPAHWAVKLFSEPAALLNYLQSDTKTHEEENWVHREIVAASREGQSAIQTILRREGFEKPYEALKGLTRKNERVTKQSVHAFIDELPVTDQLKAELKLISPENYVGVQLVN